MTKPFAQDLKPNFATMQNLIGQRGKFLPLEKKDDFEPCKQF